MTQQQKTEIVGLIEIEISRLGSQEKVSKKCQVSPATLSQMRAGNWTNIADGMWGKVASALGYRPAGWQMAEITNTRIVQHVLDNAKTQSLFLAVSHRSGSGKTSGLKAYEASNRANGVFYISCREWARREFLQQLSLNLGLDGGNKAMSMDALLMAITDFFKSRSAQRPLLILDEADKLKGPALRSLITLYNECEDILGLVISGTDHLSKQMQTDARHNRKGAEELLSRFGRRFINLVGATIQDVTQICTANGLSDKAIIDAIFKECDPVNRMVGGASKLVVEDLRRVKRAVQRELMKQMESEIAAIAEAA